MSTKSSPASRLLPSLTDVAFIMPIVLLFVKLNGTQHLLGDGDTGWHIRAGQWILANGRIPTHDMFSFTKPGQVWFAWEWLWDVIFGWLHSHWGMTAVVLGSTLVICVTYALLYRLVSRRCPNPLIAFGLTFLAIAASTIHWLARPHLFTLLFLVIFLWILERASEGIPRALWFLIPLTVLWTNLHGGFVIGLVMVGVYAAGELVGAMVEPDATSRRRALDRGKPFLLCLAGCSLASFLNPYFYHLHVHIFRYLTDNYQFEHVLEFQSLNFQHPVAHYLEPLVLLGMITLAWSLARKRFAHVILLAGCAHMALISARNIPVYAIVAAPLIAAMLHELLLSVPRLPIAAWLRRAAEGFQGFCAEVAENDALGRVPVASMAAIALLAVLFSLPFRPQSLRAEYDPKRYPAKALQVLRGPELAHSIFADDEWGDYLIYRLYPTTKVFVDGRSDFYGAKFNEKYLDVMNGKYNWKDTLKRYGIQAVVLPVAASLASTLKETPDWRPVYDDGVAIVFRRADARQLRAARPESEQVSAVPDGGVSVIARSPTIPTNVIERSRSYARR